MIIERYTITTFSGLFSGIAAMYTTPVTEITFKNLSSDKTKLKALELGFSPAVSLPYPAEPEVVENPNLRDFLENLAVPDYWLVVQSETAQPITAIPWRESFFDYREPEQTI